MRIKGKLFNIVVNVGSLDSNMERQGTVTVFFNNRIFVRDKERKWMRKQMFRLMRNVRE